MVPALLVVLAGLASAASPAAPAGVPTEKQLRADAHAWVDAFCAKNKGQCEAARGALAGYESLLPETAACESGPCKADRITSLSMSLGNIHETVAGLPAVEGKAYNDLLRLGALGGVRLAAAAARVKDELAGLPGVDQAAAAATVETLCLESPGPVCQGARQSLEAVHEEEARLDLCSARACPCAQVDELAFKADGTVHETLAAPPGVKTNTLALFSTANHALQRSTTLLAKCVDEKIAALQKGIDGFEKRVVAAEKDSAADARALPGDAQTLMDSYQEASLEADRLARLLGYEKASARREAVNAQTTRLGALRSRCFAAVTARGFTITDVLAAIGGAVPSGPAKLKPGVVLTTEKPTLLDARAMPAPSGSGPPPPPILPGDPSVVKSLLLINDKDPMIAADARRRLKLTTTVGTPGRYAPLVYSQSGNDTCGVAAQVQALRAHGLLPTSVKPEEQEKEAAQFLGAKGYYRNGTGKEYEGELLISKGMLVRKELNATWPALEAAVRRGSLIQVGVDATKLWGFHDAKVRGHSILITGGEVDKASKKLLGVYINDSGDDPPKGGRFVPVESFEKMWQNNYAEVIR